MVFGYEPVFDHYNPLGSVHGGVAATLLNSVMGCCIHTTLKAGTGYTTVEIKVNYVRAMTDKTGPVRAEGKVINVGSRIATSEGRLVDAVGQAAGARHHNLPDLPDLATSSGAAERWRPLARFDLLLGKSHVKE